MHEEKVVPARRRLSADALVAFAEAGARAAATGGGAQALAAHLGAHVDAAVLVEDAQWRHLATSGDGVPPSLRDLLPADADAAAATPLAPPADARARAFAIRAGDVRLGWLGVFPRRGELGEGAALARLCAAQIAVELSREGGGRGRRRGFWDRLLAGAYADALEARDDAQARGIALAPGYVAVALEAEGLDEAIAAQKNAELRRVALDVLANRGGGETVVIERGGGFFFLVPAPLEVDAANARTAATLIPRGVARAGLDVRVVGGVGRHVEMLGVARSVDEAREAMTIARRMFGGGRVMTHDECGVYPLLHRSAGLDPALWREFAERVLAPLRAYDEKNSTELVRTLRLFFDVGQNIKEAAAQLSVHRHTVFYRLRQIGDIARLDLDSPHDQLTVRAALAVDRLET